MEPAVSQPYLILSEDQQFKYTLVCLIFSVEIVDLVFISSFIFGMSVTSVVASSYINPINGNVGKISSLQSFFFFFGNV